MKTCENCGSDLLIKYGSGRFCSSFCARGFSTKSKRSEINEKLKIPSKYKKERECIICGKKYFRRKSKKGFKLNPNYCSSDCSNKGARIKMSQSSKLRCSKIEERIRMREIGRIGGYGNKGYTKNGNYYQSNLEKKCFEYLESLDINFEAHKELPDDSRKSDVYLVNKNIWIELDGINREKKKKYIGENYNRWMEKLDFYKSKNLNFKVLYSTKEFISYINILYSI
jgi:hypothetical protein